MKNILIYGNNSISNFLLNALNFLDYNAIDITNIDNLSEFFSVTQTDFIIDASNGVLQLDDENILFHNHEGIIELLMLSNRYKIPYLFLYREPLESYSESSIFSAFDNIKAIKKDSSLISIVQIEDIYGPDINTSETLNDFLISLENHHPMVIENDLSESYLLNQRDLISGIITISKELHTKKKAKSYTLFPEYPISEIDLAHILEELSGQKTSIEYVAPEPIGRSIEIDTDATYPDNWYPQVEIEEGLLEILKYKNVIHERSVETVVKDSEEDTFEDEPQFTNVEGNTEIDDNNVMEEAFLPIENHSSIEEKEGVDAVSTNYEPGATYYRPERTANYTSTNLSDQISDKKTKKTQLLASLTLALIITTMLPSVVFLSRYNESIKNINRANQNIAEHDYEKAYEYAEKAEKMASNLENLPIYVSILGKLSNKKEAELYNGIDTIKKSAQLGKNISLSYLETQKKIETNENTQVLGAFSINFDYSDKVKQLEQEIKSIANTSYLYARNEIEKNINALIQKSEIAGKLDPIEISSLLGYGTPKKYLIAIKDPTQVSPLGGKIYQYIEISLQNGLPQINRIVLSTELDELITEKAISSPLFKFAEIFQGESTDKIGNLSFEIDFNEYSLALINIYSKAYEIEDIDGVILMDLSIFKEIESLTSTEDKMKILGIMTSGLESKNIMLYSDTNKASAYLKTNQWDGTLLEYEDDYLYVIDSEVSNNQGQKIISRGAELEIFTQPKDEKYTRILKLTYKNQGESDFFNHIRILVPNNTLFDSASLLEGEKDTNITRTIAVNDYKTRTEINLDLLIPKQSQKTVKIQYSGSPSTHKDREIDLTVQAQPGINKGSLIVRAMYPEGVPESIAERQKTEGLNVVFELNALEDQKIEIPL